MNNLVKISPHCELVAYIFDSPDMPTSVNLEYPERSSDYWHSDTETSVEISKEQAVEIVRLLKMAFNLL